MQLDEFMAGRRGEWLGDVAVATVDGYSWDVAKRVNGEVVLTKHGVRFGIVLANLSADVVVSEEPKKRGRKAKVEVVPEATLELDDLDI